MLAGLSSTFKLVPQSCVSYMLKPAEKPHFNTKQFEVLTMCCVLVAYRTVKTRAVHASLWTNPLLTASRNSWSSGVEPSRSGPSSMLNPLDQNLIATRTYSTQVACGHAAPTNQLVLVSVYHLTRPILACGVYYLWFCNWILPFSNFRICPTGLP